MGLDMYLHARAFTARGWINQDVFESLSKALPFKHKDSATISVEVAYWRKANHIHNWFVENIQDGDDDCGSYRVGREELKELLSLCKRVKENPELAEELLPIRDGFFFGGRDYSEWYYQDINETIEQLESVLIEIPNDGTWSFEYASSW